MESKPNPEAKETEMTHYFATELRYLGKGTVDSIDRENDTAIVTIEGIGTGKVDCEMIFDTKREALEFATVPPRRDGWSSAAQLGRTK